MAAHVRVEIPVFILLVVLPAAAGALPPLARPFEEAADREALLELERGGGAAASHPDTVWFGGSGTGDGSVVRGGTWTWEAESGEIEERFRDGDEVGNRHRDGWTFDDRTARNGPSAVGSGHWWPDGVYDFERDGGSFAHRATTHANDGADDGPDPLAEPGVGGSWSVWIGTNLFLNPEQCGWSRTAGYGDGWSQGIQKTYAIDAPAGTPLAIRFFHRYAVEAGHDTCWVEVSLDGEFWDQVGSEASPDGIYSGGTHGNPRPAAAGAVDEVPLIEWPGGARDLHLRFRLASDAFLSDATEGGDFLFGWQLENIRLLRDGTPVDEATFETGMDGWEPAAFEGFDFALTTEPGRPAGRILRLSSLACPPILPCPEACGLESWIVAFADKDDCDLNDAFMDSYITSPAFAIGGPANPDLDGDEGRLLQFDVYLDGGAGFFETGPAICWAYWPYNWSPCPYTPPAGHPGAGATFNWSQTDSWSCDYFSSGAGPYCADSFTDNLSASLPADADSVILHLGAYSLCRSDPTCDINDNGAPFYDNVRFGVYGTNPSSILSHAGERYADSFPTANGDITATTARMDGFASPFGDLGVETPLRWVRSDTAAVESSIPNAAVYLRFRLTPGPCQPNLGHPFFAAFPPGQWHEARMDTARNHGTGVNTPGSYMTCFHESDPHDGTFWTGVPPAFEPCDDILPDGLFTAGARVRYFFEARDASTGAVRATFPAGRGNRPIGTGESDRRFWLETSVLPELDPACDGTYAHNMLVVGDYQTSGVPGAGTILRERLTAVLSSLGLEFDVYDGTSSCGSVTGCYEGIGRREDRPTQQPRPPHNGATLLQLAAYDCIWYYSGLLDYRTLTDKTTLSIFGGHPSQDQQTLEAWIAGCTDARPRLLVLEGLGWASDIDLNTTHGPAFLSRFGVDVLGSDYHSVSGNDLRRCARLTGTAVAPGFDGEVFGSGCPDNLRLDVFSAISSGEAVANFVESLEDGNDPVNCADDVNRPAWHAVIRKRNPNHPCERSVAMSFPFVYLYPLDCAGQCRFDGFRINGENAELVIDLFQWAGKPINPVPIGVGGPGAAPRLVNALEAAQPNPAGAPGAAVIRYAIAERGRVTLRIFDVSGRLVRALVDAVEEPGSREVVWDGRDAAGRRAGAGVYFYELRAPGYAASRKLVVLK